MKWLRDSFVSLRDFFRWVLPRHKWAYAYSQGAERRSCPCGQVEEFEHGDCIGGSDWNVLKEGDWRLHHVKRPAPFVAAPAQTQPSEDAPAHSH